MRYAFRLSMTFQRIQTELTNWSKSARSACIVYRVNDKEGIAAALAEARRERLTVIPHGAGHSYTDAALNTSGVVIDITAMRRILAWEAERGIMRVEPGVTLRDVINTAGKDGWWPAIAPSTPEATISGCAGMNVNGRNSWKSGPFGDTILELEVMLASGEECRFARNQDPHLFRIFVGSLGLLGIITSVTIQLQRIRSGRVLAITRSAAQLNEIFSIFKEEEQTSDFMEAWLDGFADGDKLGRGRVTCTKWRDPSDEARFELRVPGPPGRLEKPLARIGASLTRPILQPGVRMMNRIHYWEGHRSRAESAQARDLFSFMFWPAVAFAGYHAMFLEGVETFQAFVRGEHAEDVFRQALRYSQQHGCQPLWCIIKKHCSDPYLLSYQVDGFSLELNYQRRIDKEQTLKKVLQDMIAIVIEAGGRFYLAKDHFQTSVQYRKSVGDEVVESFLQYKQRYDPEELLQSDLFRRVFKAQPQ
jgi:decaprenylphospho-beta-D-ribofuranose 2-oxidase